VRRIIIQYGARIAYNLGYYDSKIEHHIISALMRVLPKSWTNHLTARNLGRLVVVDERLHTREVPTITAQEFMDAMKADEKR